MGLHIRPHLIHSSYLLDMRSEMAYPIPGEIDGYNCPLRFQRRLHFDLL